MNICTNILEWISLQDTSSTSKWEEHGKGPNLWAHPIWLLCPLPSFIYFSWMLLVYPWSHLLVSFYLLALCCEIQDCFSLSGTLSPKLLAMSVFHCTFVISHRDLDFLHSVYRSAHCRNCSIFPYSLWPCTKGFNSFVVDLNSSKKKFPKFQFQSFLHDVYGIQNRVTISRCELLLICISDCTEATCMPFPLSLLLLTPATTGVQRAASSWRTLGIRSCRTFCSDLAW